MCKIFFNLSRREKKRKYIKHIKTIYADKVIQPHHYVPKKAQGRHCFNQTNSKLGTVNFTYFLREWECVYEWEQR